MILGFNIGSIQASRSEGSTGDLQIHYRPKIEDVEATEVSGVDEEVAKVFFKFRVIYEAGGTEAASIDFEGNVIWRGNLDEIQEAWEENESLPEEVEARFMNDLYKKCLSQAVGIADTLNLLPPIPTPRVDQG